MRYSDDEHLVNLDVEPQVYRLRWMRVLIAREYTISHVVDWGAISSLTPSDFSFINLVVIQEF